MAKTINMITGVAALALVFGAGPAFAQYGGASQRQGGATADEQTQSKNSNASTTNSKTSADDTFARNAAEGGLAEVKLGQLAQEKGTNPAVKNFGRQMVRDHSKANDDLKTTAEKENLTLPTEMNKSDQAAYDRLSKLSGESFDKAYARDMVRDHSKDVAEFQKEAKNGRDQSIKSFAEQTVPTLQNHLDQARQMNKAVNQASNASTSNENAPGNSGTTGTTGRTGNTYPSNSETGSSPRTTR